ncbi:MAG: antibiotic biosynthesis monooxygenase [Gemmatimonadales bacterium]|jgi:heme-degrading monooxygenase HmoA
MYVYIWEYQVRPESVERFREVYGPDGDWVALFRRAASYLGTELLRDLDDPYRYVTVDRWESRQAYERFRRSFSAQFEHLDAVCEKLTLREVRLGHFIVAS